MADILSVLESFRGTAPVPVFDIVSQLGLGPEFKPLEDDVSGWIELEPSGDYRIVINSNHAPARKRFTAAHELGHYIYHRDLLGAGTGDTRAYRAEHSPLPNAAIRPRHERQANTFAANLLMPAEAISRLRAQGIREIDEMAESLGVSSEALRIRLGSNEIIESRVT
ncbi:ImmA/IrrE family metallo-endopeptidase [Novosphingobium sp. MD-1]|uniref:ImmA/IrrE family metallo-endopeptidase n=1 Tax=Novosphingobium sp. MD-1 TaxID=1630648 RepID=UPI000F7F9439